MDIALQDAAVVEGELQEELEEEEEEAPSLVMLLQEQAKLKKLIDPHGLFTSVSFFFTDVYSTTYPEADFDLFSASENVQGLPGTSLQVRGREGIELIASSPPSLPKPPFSKLTFSPSLLFHHYHSPL